MWIHCLALYKDRGKICPQFFRVYYNLLFGVHSIEFSS